MDKLWKKLFNWETVSYVFFGVLTTLVDWLSYWVLRQLGIDYRIATAGSWVAAVAFAFITNKIYVFRSMSFAWDILKKEAVPFVAGRAVTGVFTLVVMMVLVDGLNIKNDFICKVIVSAISLVLNYVISKLFVFKSEAAGKE